MCVCLSLWLYEKEWVGERSRKYYCCCYHHATRIISKSTKKNQKHESIGKSKVCRRVEVGLRHSGRKKRLFRRGECKKNRCIHVYIVLFSLRWAKKKRRVELCFWILPSLIKFQESYLSPFSFIFHRTKKHSRKIHGAFHNLRIEEKFLSYCEYTFILKNGHIFMQYGFHQTYRTQKYIECHQYIFLFSVFSFRKCTTLQY